MQMKTLGGDRLGAGKRMKVALHNYERSTHDLGFLFRSTMSAGTLVPFMCEVALPGDTWDIDLDCDVKTHPTIGPLFGSGKIQLDVFSAPIRLYQGAIHNNKLGIGRKMSDVKLPQIRLTAIPIPLGVSDLNASQINPSCILSYLGIRGIGGLGVTQGGNKTRDFNAVSLLSYWDIVKNYYANKQEEIGAVIHSVEPTVTDAITSVDVDGDVIPEWPATQPTPAKLVKNSLVNILQDPAETAQLNWLILRTIELGDVNAADILTLVSNPAPGTNMVAVYDTNKFGTLNIVSWRVAFPNEVLPGKPNVVTFPLSNIDSMREGLLMTAGSTTPKVINVDATTSALTPYNYLSNTTAILASQEGLALKTYQSDIFNNWLKTEWIDGAGGINEITAIDTSSGSFNIDTLNLSKKVYDMLNRIAVSGGTYDDWVDTVYTHDRFKRIETPVYHGGLIRELVFQEVVSNAKSEGEDGAQPLGTLAGKGVMANKKKGGKVVIKVDEPSYILGIISITPRVDYSQGNRWDVNLKTMDDFHKPALDEIGFQELITEKMAWWSTHWDGAAVNWITYSAGKQPAWIDYMTNFNRTYGNFALANNEMFMTFNRRYEANRVNPNDLPTIKDLTTYIDPSKFNFIYAQTSLDSQNYWVQVAADITARRKMSAKVMPNL